MEITIPSHHISQVYCGHDKQKDRSWIGECFEKCEAQINEGPLWYDYHKLAGEKINAHETIRRWNSSELGAKLYGTDWEDYTLDRGILRD